MSIETKTFLECNTMQWKLSLDVAEEAGNLNLPCPRRSISSCEILYVNIMPVR